jgi:hypothetical protein
MVRVLPPPETVVPETPAVVIRVIPPPAAVEIAGPEILVSRIPTVPVVTRGIQIMAIVDADVVMPIVMTGLVSLALY